MKRDNALDFGRFTEPGLLILVSLTAGPRHGYAMIQDIRALAGVTLGPGTLYGALARLERSGYIETIASNDRRVPYRLTTDGRAVVAAQLAGLRRLSATGIRRLARA
ncbi:MAG TPA: PadR family transcriptional regulator [Candidatus Acidoferrales bacterium]|nr:PadR family transcriptional regulator [Candidatus Acidoferrales bacterium]